MVNQEVPQKTTPVSQPELVAALISAAKQLYDVELTKPQVAVLMAHINLETGNTGANWQTGGVGNTSMHNYNLGNIQWTPGSGYDYFVGGDRTKRDGKWVPTHFKFLAFPTLEDGIKLYVRNIHNRGGGRVWNAILQGDTSAFAHALKQTNYYEEDEDKYNAGMQARLKTFNKGQAYEVAQSMPRETTSSQPEQVAENTPGNLDDLLNQFMEMLGAAASGEISMKRLYKNALPSHDILIQIAAPDHTSAVEFSRVLCTALDEDLLAHAYPHTDGHLVEVECSIAGPQKECFEAVQQMTQAIADTFKDATTKIGGIVIKNKVIMDKKSSYQPITPRTAGTNYRKFLLKFV